MASALEVAVRPKAEGCPLQKLMIKGLLDSETSLITESSVKTALSLDMLMEKPSNFVEMTHHTS